MSVQITYLEVVVPVSPPAAVSFAAALAPPFAA